MGVKQVCNPKKTICRKLDQQMEGLRIVCISDTHGKHDQMMNPLPIGDVLIHGGDFSSTGTEADLRGFVSWFDSQHHPLRIFIAGNHDVTLDASYYIDRGANRFHKRLLSSAGTSSINYANTCMDIVKSSTSTYLQDSSIDIIIPNKKSFDTNSNDSNSKLVCYGAPWQPEFCDWAFNLKRGKECQDKWNLIPHDTDILITHGPPLGYGDRTSTGFQCGCENLLRTIQSRDQPPRLHIFGHIHEARGTWHDGRTLYVNACTCTFFYHATNKPIVVFLPFDRSQPAFIVDDLDA